MDRAQSGPKQGGVTAEVRRAILDKTLRPRPGPAGEGDKGEGNNEKRELNGMTERARSANEVLSLGVSRKGAGPGGADQV